MKKLSIFLIMAGYAMSLLSVPGQESSADIPENIFSPATYAKLSAEKASLDRQQEALQNEKIRFNADCARVASDDAAKINECRQRQEKFLVALQQYNSKLDAYSLARSNAVVSQLTTLDARISRTRIAIRQYSEQLKNFQAELDEWTQLPLKAREEAVETARETSVSVLVDAMVVRQEEQISVAEDDLKLVNRLLLQRSLLNDLRDQVMIQQRINNIRTYRDVLEVVGMVREAMAATSELKKEDREAIGKALLHIIAAANNATIHQPGINILISDGELAIADTYAWKAGVESRSRVEQLLTLSDQMLKGLKAETNLYKKDIDDRKTLRKML